MRHERVGDRGGDASGFTPGAQSDTLVDRVVSIEPGASPAGRLVPSCDRTASCP